MIKHPDLDIVDARLTLIAGIVRAHQTNGSEFAGHLAIAREALARVEACLAKALAALTDLYEHHLKIDDGHCTYCEWYRYYDGRGRALPCKNPDCLSARVEAPLKGIRR